MCQSGDKGEDPFWRYQNERHARYIASRDKLDDLAFKTCERYDQWILTISGGALAVSLTFVEKIAPAPSERTIALLLLAWLGFVVSILSAFIAISYSRKAIYRQIEIVEARYSHFRKTASVQNPAGEEPPDLKNEHVATVELANKFSAGGLVIGCALLCFFAFANMNPRGNEKAVTLPPRIDLNVNFRRGGNLPEEALTNSTPPLRTNLPSKVPGTSTTTVKSTNTTGSKP